MNLNRSPKSAANQGSVLLVAVGTVVVLGIILAAVLALITQERRVLARTAAWNTALPAAEAGIEEAMSHLHQVQDGSRTVGEWVPGTNGTATLTRYLSTGSRYTVGIDNRTAPTIISTGETYCTNVSKFIKRTVMVTTTNAGPFRVGMVARRRIAVGGGFLVDSFDSLKSTNGLYHSSIRSDKGSVASNSSEPGAITLSGSTKIYGSLSTGPTGTVVIANNQSAGSISWVDGGKKGIEPGRYSKDMNLSFDPVTLPFTSAPKPLKDQMINGVTYRHVLQDGDYQLSTLDVKSDAALYVSGKARLLVDKDISGSGSWAIYIATNASLEVYVNKGSVKLTGASVLNASGKAGSFSLFGTSGLSDIEFSGDFIGVIYAPDTSLKMTGGGEVSGAVVVDEINARGSYNFHFDEALLKYKPKEYVITSWVEL